MKPTLTQAVDRAAAAIPPAWPLASSVAVNPFLGQANESLATAGARLARVAGVRVTLPRAWFRSLIAQGVITDRDLSEALSGTPVTSLAALKAAAAEPQAETAALPTIAELAAEASGIDWAGLIADRFGAWAGGYLDEGQALWAAPRGRGAYAAWRAVATHDLTPEIAGLSGFASFVSNAPETAEEAVARAVQRLGLPAEALETYFHRLLMTLGGWAQYASHQRWQAIRDSSSDYTITDFLTIRLLWEEALFARYEPSVGPLWADVRMAHAEPVAPDAGHVLDAILQEAWERAVQRSLAATLDAPLAKPARARAETRPALHAAFCIDVRSEVFRRHLEAVSPGVQTFGMAGFFGLAAAHRRFASDLRERHLPVLIAPSLLSCSGAPGDAASDLAARYKARAKRAWSRFKLAAVSSFAFVEATGPIYAAKLVRDALALEAPPVPKGPPPRLDPPPDRSARVQAAEAVLRAMSLTGNFARLVLVAGHGAGVVNTPHASALQCGACGGYSGEVNARLLAGLLNDPAVRTGLSERGIAIPADTLFIAALHDTTTDRLTLYAADHPSPAHRRDLAQARVWLAEAGKRARGDRARIGTRRGSPRKRSRDWSEVRPEWGLAGCQAFIVAARHRTTGRDLGGRAFLHDYDWRQDDGFGLLEQIMTAPVVVASWISLQYYGSTVAPQVFGGGNKLLHNVVGGIGVLEGHGGLMRTGLPWQSVHDGSRYIHEPLRLSVCIEAPREAITDVLRRHPDVRDLFDHRWLHLFALDDAGRMAWRYAGDLQWTDMLVRDVVEQPGLTEAV